MYFSLCCWHFEFVKNFYIAVLFFVSSFLLGFLKSNLFCTCMYISFCLVKSVALLRNCAIVGYFLEERVPSTVFDYTAGN